MNVTNEMIYDRLQAMAQDIAMTQRDLTDFKRQVDTHFIDQFAYFDNAIKHLHERLEHFATKQEVRDTLARMDKHYAWLDIHETELGALRHQTGRHESWIQKVIKSVSSYARLS